MGIWRYVVSCANAKDDDGFEWEIRELYPSDDGSFGYTESSVKPYGKSFEELARDLEHMRQDSRLDILDIRSEGARLVPLESLLEELSDCNPHLDQDEDATQEPHGNQHASLVDDSDMAAIVRKATEDRPRIVCICGSTRFRDEIMEANQRLTLAGVIVVAPALFQHRGDTITDEQKQVLDELHLKKIDLADAVLIVDPGGYIGESTSREMAYARSSGKPVFRLSSISESAA
ncbi:MAG: hypothetical protein QM708_05345 [Propioniciclava sp.]|uniref:hypothetical protein n=1 Tax=Propioniciclava sp. TaxID=2038686 RepID=UPI0039E26341